MPDLWLWLAIIATNLLIVAVFIYAYLKFQDVFGYVAEHERRLEALEGTCGSSLVGLSREIMMKGESDAKTQS